MIFTSGQSDFLLNSLLDGAVSAVSVDISGKLSISAPPPAVLLPGSFNPVHEGHWRLHAVAATMTGAPVSFELSVINVDKPPLDVAVIQSRLCQFVGRASIWLTRAPTFVEKAVLFPGAVFVVGADTACRIIAPRYYGNSASNLLHALERIRASGCRFLVAGRLACNGEFVTVEQLALPDPFQQLFTSIPESLFRFDLSSTELRRDESAAR